MAGEANFIWDLLSDVWDGYEERDQIASMWEGYLQIASDLLLQILQADQSKSIIDIPVFRRYRWKNYPLTTTVRPANFQSAFLFAYTTGDVDILSIPNLQDLVRDPEDDEYLQVTNSATGMTLNGTQLQDVATPIPAHVRVGDFVRFLSGTSLSEADTDTRFQITRIESSTLVSLNVIDLDAASSLRYVIERSPVTEIVEGVHYVTTSGKLNFSPAVTLTPDGTAPAFRAVQSLEYIGDFVRDDPRSLSNSGNAVTSGAGDIVKGSEVLTDVGATFLTGAPITLPGAGDYLVLRPSGVQPTQTLTTQEVYKVALIISDTQLAFAGKAPTTTGQVTYDILRPSGEDFDLISTEDGLAGFSLGYAYQTVGAAAPSGSSGEMFAADQFRDAGVSFAGLVGARLRILSGAGLVPAELGEFIIVDVLNGPAWDTLQLDRSVTGLSTGADAIYIVGEVLAIDLIDVRPASGAPVGPDVFQFENTSSNAESVTDGAIFFNNSEVPSAGPLIKSIEDRAAESTSSEPVALQLWAAETLSNQDALYANFGFPIQVQQENSKEYKSVLQGLWYAYWNGPSLDNIVRGLNLVFDLPFSPKDGVISDISLPDPAQLIGTVTSLPTNTFDTSAANPQGDSRFLSFNVDNLPPTLVTFADTAANPNTAVRDTINLAVGAPIASLNGAGQMVLSGLTAVKIDTVIGNPGLGFEAGGEDFGTFNVLLNYDDGTAELLEFGTQFPLSVEVGERVDRFQPLTTAVGVFDYVELPQWWTVFNIASINPNLAAYSNEDRAILNDILKDFTFAVRVVADAFTRLGPVDRSVVGFFLEQIKPIFSDFLFIVAESFYDIVSVTDDRGLLQAVPPPSPEFRAQHSGEAPYMPFELGIQNLRSIAWNFANYNQLTPAERANFEANYQLSQYDDFRLATEDVTVVSPAKIDVIAGTGSSAYRSAVVNGTVATDVFYTTEALAIKWAGFVPFIIQSSAFQAASVGNTPLFTMTASQAVAFINAQWLAIYAGSFLNQTLVQLNPDGTLRMHIDNFSGGPVRLQILLQHSGFGFPISDVSGVVTSSLGPFLTVNAS